MDRARAVASALLARGHGIVSRWHNEPKDQSTERRFQAQSVQRPLFGSPRAGDPMAAMRAQLEENDADLAACDVLVALTHEDDQHHAYGRQTYVEIGQANILGKWIVWSTEAGGATLAQAYPRVRLVERDEWIAPVLDVLEAGVAPVARRVGV